MLTLGYVCAHCGKTDDLTFDCIQPCGDTHHRMNSYDRILFYLKQHKNKNVQILCDKCNTKKSQNEQPDEQNVPF